jgi:hypothetical protein
VKSATDFSLMVDGSGSRSCRIFGRLRPVRIVRKRIDIGASKRRAVRYANRSIGCARNGYRPLLPVYVDKPLEKLWLLATLKAVTIGQSYLKFHSKATPSRRSLRQTTRQGRFRLSVWTISLNRSGI